MMQFSLLLHLPANNFLKHLTEYPVNQSHLLASARNQEQYLLHYPLQTPDSDIIEFYPFEHPDLWSILENTEYLSN